MANSGYGLRQIRRVMLSGIKGYEKMIRQERKGIRRVHRTAKESNKIKASKKLTGKSEWFRKEKNTDQELDREERDERVLNKYLMDGNNQEAGNVNNKEIPTRTVLFVENTKGGELAKRLREVERKTQNMMGFKTKIVEGVGSKLKNLLPNSNSWKGAGCAREGCIPCAQPGDRKQDCRKRKVLPKFWKKKVRKIFILKGSITLDQTANILPKLMGIR